MFDEIKKLADEAVRVQNKMGMESALKKISALCDEQSMAFATSSMAAETLPARIEEAAAMREQLDGPIEAGDVLVDADGKEHKVESVGLPDITTIADGLGYGPLTSSLIDGGKPKANAGKKGGKK